MYIWIRTLDTQFLHFLETKGMTSKGLWGTVSKLQKSLGRTTYEEFAVALTDTDKMELLEETITTLEDIRNNILNIQSQKGDTA